jgi:hypothetical protein
MELPHPTSYRGCSHPKKRQLQVAKSGLAERAFFSNYTPAQRTFMAAVHIYDQQHHKQPPQSITIEIEPVFRK